MTLRLALKMHLDVHGWQWCRNQRVWPNTWDSQGSSFSLEWGVMVCTAMCVLCLVAQSCPALCNPLECGPPGSSVHGDSPGKNTGVGCHAPSRGYSQSRDQIQISCIAGKFFTIWATREAHSFICGVLKKYLTNIEQFDGCQREEVYEWVKWLKVVKSSNFQL